MTDASRTGQERGRSAARPTTSTSHYRAAAVFDFFEQQGLTADRLRVINRHQVQLLKTEFERLDCHVIGRVRRADAGRAPRRLSGDTHERGDRCCATPARTRRAQRRARRCAPTRTGALLARRPAARRDSGAGRGPRLQEPLVVIDPLRERSQVGKLTGARPRSLPAAASIGYSASHGCIRMHIPSAEWLFQHVSVGTPVYIVRS